MSNPMNWWDLVILTAIFFGSSIMLSTQSLLTTDDAIAPSVPEFGSLANWTALIQQALLFAIGAAYICARRLKLSSFTLKPTVKGTLFAVALFALSGLVFDIAYMVYGAIFSTGEVSEPTSAASGLTDHTHFDFSLLVYSLFNGFYEEFFFLIICLSMPMKWHSVAVIYSLVIRVSFHTYQGLFNAMMIGVVFGIIAYVFIKKFPEQRIYPVVVAHALADFFGAGLLNIIFPS